MKLWKPKYTRQNSPTERSIAVNGEDETGVVPFMDVECVDVVGSPTNATSGNSTANIGAAIDMHPALMSRMATITTGTGWKETERV